MNGARRPSRDDLLDALFDLKHDLGKYLRWHLSTAPEDAGPERFREALATALLCTRTGPRGDRAAREIWEKFEGETGSALDGYPARAALSIAVRRALGHERALAPDAPLDRGEIRRDLGAVSDAIRALIEEVERDA